MPYPFEQSPLNDYLKVLRKLRKEEKYYFDQLQAENIDTLSRKHIYDEYSKYLKKIENHQNNCSIKARKEHVFLNKAELAVTRYEIENPEPFYFKDCLHKIQLCVDTHEDKTTHLVEQCTKCGLKFRRKKKKDFFQWENLPKVNKQLGKKEREQYSQWKYEKYKIYRELSVEGENIPENFDSEKFRLMYEQDVPPPFSSDCTHNNIIITYRKYSKGDAVVKQCTECGKHISSIKKSSVKEVSTLPLFDEEKEKIRSNIYQEWFSNYIKEEKRAKKRYEEKVYNDILKGKYSYTINSTFNTYYTSDEWEWVRRKIFKRDNNSCQSCGHPAQCVHHITYERLGKESSFDLISLCNICHDEVHFLQREHSYSYHLTPNEISSLHKRI